MKKIVADLLKYWGIQRVIKVIISLLETQGSNEHKLAVDLERALQAYQKRRK